MKKLLGVLLILALTIGTVFAGGQGEKSKATKSGKKKDIYIAVISKGFQHEFWQAVKKGTEKAAKELGIRTTYEGPATEAMLDVQINMVENAITTRCDGLLLAALDSEALVPYVEKAHKAGIVVATFDSGVKSDIPVSHIATNNLKAGALGADKLGEIIGGKGKVGVIVHDATSQTGIERRDGFINEIKKKFPGITIVGPVYGEGDHRKSANLIIDMIRSNPDLKGIFAANEGSAVGAALALKEMKRTDIKLVGFDSGAQQIGFVKDGTEVGFISQDPFNIGYLGVKTLYKALMGEKVPKIVDTGAKWVDKNNIDDPAIQKILYH